MIPKEDIYDTVRDWRKSNPDWQEQFKKDDEALFGSESKYHALLRIAQELQTCCDNMGLKPGTEDPEIVARARSASVQLNQLLGSEFNRKPKG